MSATAGRVIRAGEARGRLLSQPDGPSRSLSRRIAATEAAAMRRAEAILSRAEREAESIVVGAESRASDVELQAEARAQASALARVATALSRAAEREQAADEGSVTRAIALAELIAERLLGKALAIDPQTLGDLAATAVEEARGARRVTIETHPDDAPVLTDALPRRLAGKTIEIAVGEGLARGDLRLITDVGTVDARLGARIAELAVRLRESLDP